MAYTSTPATLRFSGRAKSRSENTIIDPADTRGYVIAALTGLTVLAVVVTPALRDERTLFAGTTAVLAAPSTSPPTVVAWLVSSLIVAVLIVNKVGDTGSST